MKKHKSRRNFIKQIAAGAAGIAIANNLSAGHASEAPSPSKEKSKVILIRNNSVVDSEGNTKKELIKEMLDEGIQLLTNKSSVPEAWSTFFTKEDTVGIKLNALGLSDLQETPYIGRFSQINEIIIDSLEQIGISSRKIITWDRSDEELQSAGLQISKDGKSAQVKGIKDTRRGEGTYNPTSYPVGSLSTKVCSILADECTALINVPVLKTHRNAGISGSLKNHYGTIDNPRDFHADNCNNPGIAEINMVTPIQEKQKLIICDALMGLYDGGPRWSKESMFPYGGIILGTDPVAVDAIMLQIINQQRNEMGLEPVETATHIALSGEAGLGNHSLAMIDLEEISG